MSHQRELSEEIITALENERSRVSKDLHDDLGNDLAVLKMKLQKLKMDEPERQETISLVDKASTDVRNIAHNLMPPYFNNTDFIKLIESFYADLKEQSLIAFRFQTSGVPNHFTKSQELMIYRIIMELTNNIIKHSQATEATVQLLYYERFLEIMIEDNGKGFDFKQLAGFGLRSIQSRVEFLQGKFSMDSQAGGTTIIIELPYPNI